MKRVLIDLDDCYPLLTEHAKGRWDDIKSHGKLDQFFDLINETFNDYVRLSEIDDYLKYEYEDIAEKLGFEAFTEEAIKESRLNSLINSINIALGE